MFAEFGLNSASIFNMFPNIPQEVMQTYLPNFKPSLGKKLSGAISGLKLLWNSGSNLEYIAAAITKYSKICTEKYNEDLSDWTLNQTTEKFQSMMKEFCDFGLSYLNSQIYVSIFTEVVKSGLQSLKNKDEIFASEAFVKLVRIILPPLPWDKLLSKF